VSNGFAATAVRQSEPVQGASGDSETVSVLATTNLVAINPASTHIVPLVAATSSASALDKSNPVQSTNTNDGGQAGQQAAQSNGYLQLGAAPPSLQLHSASSLAGQSAPFSVVNPAVLIEQVAYAVQYGHSNGQQMQLHLNPPELGALQVDVALHDGMLSARIEAQTPAAQQILVDNISQLKESLTQQGVNFDRIDVHLAGSHSGSGGSSTADRSFAQQHDGALPWDQPVPQPESADTATARSAPVARNSRIPLTSLDIMI
jgi:flagellar hook-length control protein FliK